MSTVRMLPQFVDEQVDAHQDVLHPASVAYRPAVGADDEIQPARGESASTAGAGGAREPVLRSAVTYFNRHAARHSPAGQSSSPVSISRHADGNAERSSVPVRPPGPAFGRHPLRRAEPQTSPASAAPAEQPLSVALLVLMGFVNGRTTAQSSQQVVAAAVQTDDNVAATNAEPATQVTGAGVEAGASAAAMPTSSANLIAEQEPGSGVLHLGDMESSQAVLQQPAAPLSSSPDCATLPPAVEEGLPEVAEPGSRAMEHEATPLQHDPVPESSFTTLRSTASTDSSGTQGDSVHPTQSAPVEFNQDSLVVLLSPATMPSAATSAGAASIPFTHADDQPSASYEFAPSSASPLSQADERISARHVLPPLPPTSTPPSPGGPVSDTTRKQSFLKRVKVKATDVSRSKEGSPTVQGHLEVNSTSSSSKKGLLGRLRKSPQVILP